MSDLIDEIKAISKAMETFRDKGIGYEEARILLVNQKGWTFGHAADELEMWEKLTGIQLER